VIVSRYNAGADRRAFSFTARTGIEDAPEFEPDLLPAAGSTVALYGFNLPGASGLRAALSSSPPT
jgi:hypothetical protein